MSPESPTSGGSTLPFYLALLTPEQSELTTEEIAHLVGVETEDAARAMVTLRDEQGDVTSETVDGELVWSLAERDVSDVEIPTASEIIDEISEETGELADSIEARLFEPDRLD